MGNVAKARLVSNDRMCFNIPTISVGVLSFCFTPWRPYSPKYPKHGVAYTRVICLGDLLAHLGIHTSASFGGSFARLPEWLRSVRAERYVLRRAPFSFYGYDICNGVLFTLDVCVRGEKHMQSENNSSPAQVSGGGNLNIV